MVPTISEWKSLNSCIHIMANGECGILSGSALALIWTNEGLFAKIFKKIGTEIHYKVGMRTHTT